MFPANCFIPFFGIVSLCQVKADVSSSGSWLRLGGALEQLGLGLE